MRRFVVLLAIVLLFAGAATRAHALTLEETRAAIQRAGADWTAGDTEVARLHNELGWYSGAWELPPPLTGFEEIYLPTYDPLTLPAKLDWRNKDGVNWVTPIRNQYQCGSCWAFATAGPIESHIAFAENWPDPVVDLSEQEMLSCESGNSGCNGGLTTTSFDFAKNVGLFDEACLPYHARDDVPCDDRCSDWQKRLYKIDSWKIIGKWGVLVSPQDIMDALQNGPVGTSMVIYEDFEYYDGGTYQTVIGTPLGFHAVTIVGYDADAQVWYCKNSWGEYWGQDGFFTIKWGAAFIGLFTILPHYTSQGLGPWPPDDDTADDDAADDDAADDDQSDDDTGVQPDCTKVCDRLDKCNLLDDLNLTSADDCQAKCGQFNAAAYECMLNALNCDQLAQCVGVKTNSGSGGGGGGGCGG